MADTQCPKPGHNGWLGKCLECARDEDFSPFGDATTPGFFLKPSTPAAPETPRQQVRYEIGDVEPPSHTETD